MTTSLRFQPSRCHGLSKELQTQGTSNPWNTSFRHERSRQQIRSLLTSRYQRRIKGFGPVNPVPVLIAVSDFEQTIPTKSTIGIRPPPITHAHLAKLADAGAPPGHVHRVRFLAVLHCCHLTSPVKLRKLKSPQDVEHAGVRGISVSQFFAML